MASRRGTQSNPGRAEFDQLETGIERLRDAAAALQHTLPLEQQIAYVLDAAREAIDIDRLTVWALAPEADRLIHVASSGISETDRLSLEEYAEIPLAEAGAMAMAHRSKEPLVVDQTHRLPADARLRPPYSATPALRTNSFVVVPISARGSR